MAFFLDERAGGVVRVASHSGNNPDTATETITWSKFVEDFSKIREF